MANFGEKEKALQQYFLPQYEDFLACVLNAGGYTFHSQMARLLFNNQSDTRGATTLGDNFCEAYIFRKGKAFRNKIYIPTLTLLSYFNLTHISTLNNSRLKLSSLIFEAYLQKGYYAKENPAQAMRKRLEAAGIRAYQAQGKPHIPQLEHLITAFQEHGYNTDGLTHQLKRMQARVEFAFSGNFPDRLQLPKETDLYSLSCKNIYLAGVTIRPNEFGRKRPVGLIDIYYITTWEPRMMAKNIIETKRTIEAILGNDSTTEFTIHSHNVASPQYENSVRRCLTDFPECILQLPEIKYKWYDTAYTLFGGNNPDSLI